MKTTSLPALAERIAGPLAAIASPQRIAILLAIGKGEACVCHLEAALGWRQPYISQHLMELRRAGLLSHRRRGRFVFYRVTDRALLELVLASARLAGATLAASSALDRAQRNTSCQCPQCSPVIIPAASLKVA
jgi:ArsR family transcriptional regulator